MIAYPRTREFLPLVDPFRITSSLRMNFFPLLRVKKGRKGAMVIKLDLEKTYDFLNWDCIKGVLAKFSFNNHWIKLIMECITSTSFSILINGKAHGYFCPSRGIRQGDSLLPFIFIFCMEPLIRYLNKLGESSKCNVGLLTAFRGFRNTNLMFADDCLILLRLLELQLGILLRFLLTLLKFLVKRSTIISRLFVFQITPIIMLEVILLIFLLSSIKPSLVDI